MNVFEAKDYKSYLRYRVEEVRGNLTLFAKKANCQASYLLRVIHEEAQLTPDQAHRLCDYWALESAEREFFMTQLSYARAADPGYRAYLQTELDQLLKQHNNLKEVVQRSEASDVQVLLEYHNDWRISLIHFLSACENFQSKQSLSHRCRMSWQDLNEILSFLQNHNLISVNGDVVKLKNGSVHIPRNSPVLPVFLNNWRQLSVQKSLKDMGKQSIHFTNIQTIGKFDIQKLIEMSKQFIQKSKNICDESASEEVIVMNLDLFIP